MVYLRVLLMFIRLPKPFLHVDLQELGRHLNSYVKIAFSVPIVRSYGNHKKYFLFEHDFFRCRGYYPLELSKDYKTSVNSPLRKFTPMPIRKK